MWMPEELYKLMPHFWFFLGLLFIGCGLYLGFDYVLSIYYASLGALCSAYGAAVLLLRYVNRRKIRTAEEKQHRE